MSYEVLDMKCELAILDKRNDRTFFVREHGRMSGYD
jgi:hypothetical protein